MKLSLSIHFSILLLVTICMWLVGNSFYVNELISHPQFDVSTPYYIAFIEDLKNETYYYNFFFLIDFVWAAILLFFIYRILDFLIENKNSLINKKKFFKIFASLFILTYGLDFIEGCLYLTFNFQLLEIVKPIKEFFYAWVFLIFLFVVIYKYKSILIKFINNAKISLLFIIIVSFLIGFVDQGGDILITLFESKVNLVLTLVLLYVVAIPTAHYPVYFRYSKYMNSNNYEFVMNKKFKLLSFGTIYFAKNSDAKKLEKQSKKIAYQEIFLMQFLRRCLGVLFFISFFFMVLSAYDKTFNTKITIPITSLLAILLFWFTWNFSKLKEKVDTSFKKKTYDDEKNTKRIERFIFIIKMTPYILFVIGILILYFLIGGVEWSKQYMVFVIITNFLLAISYIIFIVGRSYLKYVFYSESYTNKFLEANPQAYINETVKQKIKPSKKIFSFISQFSNNIVYLKLISVIGFLCVFFLIYLNFNWSAIHTVNPIPIFLMYYMGYYGILVIFIKHRKYYLQEKNQVLATNLEDINKYKSWWKNYIPDILAILILIGMYSTFTGNDLHELQTLERSDPTSELTLKEYEKSLLKKEKHYFAASYGGGLKSNLWTMLLLDTLENNDKSDFFENARCISTVSGGSVGTVNYAYLKANNIQNRSKRIEQLGRLNSLSLDFIFALGRDWLSELVPNQIVKFKGKDRSFYGMKQHLFAIDSSKVKEEKTFYTTYHKIKNSFPPLIINSTSLRGRYANSLSLVLDSTLYKNYDSIFPGAINILGSEKGRELSLYRVASMSNRFPFLSPAAKIKTKGYFLDGGIFENSGLLSAHSFANYLLSKKVIKKNDTVNNIKFVNFVNSKEEYILQFIEDNEIFLGKEKETPEIVGVLNAVSATGLNPRYIKEFIKNKYKLISIYLPHYFTFNDLKKMLGGFPDYKKGKLKEILQKIKANNDTIKLVLDSTDYYNRKKWGIVQPATGRLLSEASVKYQKMMVNFHPNVIKELKKLEKSSSLKK
ncbi:MAG: hypothetical protein ACPGTO_03860 [Polaribacter sp.]